MASLSATANNSNWAYAQALSSAATDACAQGDALWADDSTASGWYHTKPAHFADAAHMARIAEGCVVLQSDNNDKGKRYQIARVDNYLYRVTRPRKLRRAAWHAPHLYPFAAECELEEGAINGDLNLYTDLEAFMPCKLFFDFEDNRGTATQTEVRAGVGAVLDAACAHLAEQIMPTVVDAAILRGWTAVHQCEGDKPSYHGMLLRGPYAESVYDWTRFAKQLQHRLPQDTLRFLDLAVLRVGAYRDLGMTKRPRKGKPERFLHEAPDPELSGVDALALFASDPLLYRALWCAPIIHPHDLARPELCVDVAAEAGGGTCHAGTATKRQRGGGGGGPYTNETVLAKVDALFKRAHPDTERRRGAVYTDMFAGWDVMVSYDNSAQTTPCKIAGRRHANSTNRAFALIHLATGEVGYGCHNRQCGEQGKVKGVQRVRLGYVRGSPQCVL